MSSPRVPHLNHLAPVFVVDDVEPCVAFWVGRFGFEAKNETPWHDGKLFFLFGDTMTTPTFNGQPNGPNDPPRVRDDNDSIGYTTDTNVDQCLKLDFTTDSIGAFASPVVLNDQGQGCGRLLANSVVSPRRRAASGSGGDHGAVDVPARRPAHRRAGASRRSRIE